jgi:glycosyltransferase involved in cell wall biosynthesis
VGALETVKRWDRLLRAAHVLKEKGFDFRVRIVGDGSLRGSLEKQAAAFGLLDRVEFTGHVDNVELVLSSATFLVHTADTEGCPNVVLEAMACNRAVVATDVGDVPVVVDDGKTGFVVKRDDEDKLLQRMATLILNRELCTRLGEAGRMKAEQEFTIARLLDETFAVYQAAGWMNLVEPENPDTRNADCPSQAAASVREPTKC